MEASKRAKAARAAERSSRARYLPLKEDDREPSTRTTLALGTFGECWCGEITGHTWAGKDSGAPHPR